MKHVRKLGLLLVVAGLLAAAVISVPVISADGPTAGRAGRAEVRFLQGMIDHHQMALDMAADCLPKAVNAAVKTFCQAVIDAQSVEIKQMQSWLLAWYQVSYTPMPMAHMLGLADGMSMGGFRVQPADPHSGHGGAATPTADPHAGHSGSGKVTEKRPDDPPMMMGMMAGLSALSGAPYEVAWLEAMIDHHGDALHMSERILKTAQHAELKALAEAIIKAQTAEIAQMEALITQIGG